MKRLGALDVVAEVVKKSSSCRTVVEEEVGGIAPTVSLWSISSCLRFPGEETVWVFAALRGVSGGGMAIWETCDVTLDRSSSSLGGHSKNSSSSSSSWAVAPRVGEPEPGAKC